MSLRQMHCTCNLRPGGAVSLITVGKRYMGYTANTAWLYRLGTPSPSGYGSQVVDNP